jgi:peptidoglycan/xylan/chitin deacetylase (PgdA/CDA1 family)
VLDSSVDRLELTTGPLPLSLELGEPSRADRWQPGAAPSNRRQWAYLELWRAVRALEPTAQAAALSELRRRAGVGSAPRASHRPMTVAELRDLGRSEVVDIGCHTVNHPSLPLQTPAVRRAEIEDARQACRQLVGRLPATFAYPYGDHDAPTVDLVRDAGFEAACTTDEAGATPGCNVLALPRLQVMDWSADQLAKRLRVL